MTKKSKPKPKPHPFLVDWVGGDPMGELAKPQATRVEVTFNGHKVPAELLVMR